MVTYSTIDMVARPIRCYKKLDRETEYQERWIWMDMRTKQFHWAKRNPLKGGDDLPCSVPPPVAPCDVTDIPEIEVVEVTKAQAKQANSKSFTVKTIGDKKGHVSHVACRHDCNIMVGETHVKCAQLVLCLDPDIIPPSLMKMSKSIFTGMTAGAVSHVELFIPHDESGNRAGSSFYYTNVMRKLAIDKFNIY